MIQVQQLIGMPIVNETGNRIGNVNDVWFDEFWNLIGFVLDARVLFRKSRKVVYWGQIAKCGDSALVARGNTVSVTVAKRQLMRTFHTGLIQLKDMPVLTKDGQKLGEIADLFCKESGLATVIGFELSDGFLADVLEGRRRIFLPDQQDNIVLGQDAIFVPSSFEKVLV